MHARQRASVFALATALASTLVIAGPVSAKQAAKTAAKAAPTKVSTVVALVGTQPITRDQVVDQILTVQTARIGATNPTYADRQRVAAGSIGALVLKKMAAAQGKPVSITRADISDWLFKDKPTILYDTIQNMIVERVVAQAAKKAGVSVTPAEVNAAFNTSVEGARKQFNLAGQSDQQVLAAFGMQPSYLRSIVTTQTLLEKMVRKDVEKKLGHPVGPADFVQASHVLVRVIPKTAAAPGPNGEPAKATKEEEDKAFAEGKTKIDQIAADIKAGKLTFEKAAEENNDNDASKYQKGSLGIFMRGNMVPEFDKTAFSLEPGKISEPIRTQFGWHLVRVDKAGKDIPAAEREQTLKNSMRPLISAKVQELMKQIKVTNYYQPPQQPMMMPMQPQG